MKKGFTLIELLIVVAIIAILAAIAVPNFLEAQTRSKVARIKADMRTCGIALESYAVDNNGKYPPLRGYMLIWPSNYDRGSIGAVTDLSTPVAYLSSVMVKDPFYRKGQSYAYGTDSPIMDGNALSICINYINVQLYRKVNKRVPLDDGRPKWFMLSVGPDQARGPDPRGPQYGWGLGDYANSNVDPAKRFDAWNYDPSNGSMSGGDILYHP